MKKANQFTIRKDKKEVHLDGFNISMHISSNSVTINNKDTNHFKEGEQMSILAVSDGGSFRGRYYVKKLIPKGDKTIVHFGPVKTRQEA